MPRRRPSVRRKIQRRSSRPWVFQTMVEKRATRIAPESVVDVIDRDGIRVGRGFFNAHSRFALHILTVLERELNDLRRLLAPATFTMLQQKVPVWVEWDERIKSRPGSKDVAMARYRARPYSDGWDDRDLGTKAEEWRRAMQRLNPRAGSVEVCTLRLLGEARQPGSARQQVIMRHEVAHAVHDRLLGRDHPDLRAAFQQAVDRKLYEDVPDRCRRRTRGVRADQREGVLRGDLVRLPALVQLFPVQLHATPEL